MYTVFCDWLLLLSIKLLKITCVVARVSSLFLVIAVFVVWRDVEALISDKMCPQIFCSKLTEQIDLSIY